MPFTRRIEGEVASFLVATCRGVAVVAAVFCTAVATLLIANYVQMATVTPLDSPALATLREQYRAAPGDDELARQIRALDLAARRSYFTRQWQTRTGAVMLAVGAVVLLASLRAVGALLKRLPQPGREEDRGLRVQGRSARIGLAIAGIVLVAGGLSASLLSGRLIAEEALAARPSIAVGPAATDELEANWPQFRGPGGNGIAGPQSPPADWDGRSGRNIAWKAEVPLPGRGSPVVWDDRVYLSGADASSREVFCWDTATGVLRWRTPIPTGAGAALDGLRVTPDTGYAASTMAVDGRAVYAVFATGDLAALDLDGRILWSRSLGVPDLNYGYGSSPAILGDLLILQYDQREGGRLIAIETATGRTRWEIPREVTSSWASPVVVDTEAGVRVFLNGAPALAAYDPATRSRRWELDGMLGENAPSPAYAEGRLFAANQLLSLVAVDAVSGEKLWEVYDDLPDVASPLAFDGLVVMTASYGVVSCLEAATGEVLVRREFPTGFWASPILARGLIYALDQGGVMRIFSADRSMQLLASPAIGEPTVATPAFRGGELYIRGERTLFCIREEP